MPIGSKILIYSSNAAIREKLVQTLMYQKFVPKAVEAIPYANLALASGEYPIFLCDYAQEGQALFDFLKIIRQDKIMRLTIPLIIISNPTRESLENLIKIGCSNFVLHSEGNKILIDKVEVIAESIGDMRDKRQFVRVEIPEYENSKLLITARNGNKYPVLINNISMGGLQLAWSPEKVPVQKMNIGDILTNCLLVAKNLDLYLDLKIISVFSYKASGQFIDLNEERQSKLCNFLYEKLMAESIP
jgi:CheY-like chemotaxis protein